MHLDDLQFIPVGQAYLHRPPLPDHVQARRDQSVGGHDKPGSDPLFIIVAAKLCQHDDRVPDLLGQALGIEWLPGGQRLAKRICLKNEQAKRYQHSENVHAVL